MQPPLDSRGGGDDALATINKPSEQAFPEGSAAAILVGKSDAENALGCVQDHGPMSLPEHGVSRHVLLG